MHKFLFLALLAGLSAQAQTTDAAALKATEAMAQSVMTAWPKGVVATTGKPGSWGYEEGVLLDGLAAEWHQTANGNEFAYIKDAVDKYVTKDGTIQMDASGKPFAADEHQLDHIALGRAILLVYRVTQQEKYYKAAKFLHDQLDQQPRTASGGYWHKTIYPNQMWLDGAYMAEPFRAQYAATFHQPADFDDIAKQFQLMYDHMRDPKSGLLKHGWDESKSMPWADPKTGLSPEVWARALGWYCVALVDVLDWIPASNPNHAKLIAILRPLLTSVIQNQDPTDHLWWQVMNRHPVKYGMLDNDPRRKDPKAWDAVHAQEKAYSEGNYPEASASCMFVYALAKSVRVGLADGAQAPEWKADALLAWSAIQQHFVKSNADGTVTLTGTVKVGGLGGKPYRSGTYDYYISEKTGDNDAKGVGAYLMAGSEMEHTETEALGQGKTVLLDAWFNSQTRKNAAGQTELFHYKWDDDANSGFSFFGHAFQSYGATLAQETTAPTAADLKPAQIYILASPDIPAKNPNPHYMDKPSGDAIEAWVKAGGVLLLLENDKTNSEFDHFDTLSDRFGIHFNAVLRNTVEGNHYEQGRLDIPATTGVFAQPHQAYLKEISTITVSGPAKAVDTDKGDVLMAVSHIGKGVVYAVTDPWFYNEYTDGRKLPAAYDTYATAKDLARWAIEQANAVKR